jgi:hypothetical protein
MIFTSLLLLKIIYGKKLNLPLFAFVPESISDDDDFLPERAEVYPKQSSGTTVIFYSIVWIYSVIKGQKRNKEGFNLQRPK